MDGKTAWLHCTCACTNGQHSSQCYPRGKMAQIDKHGDKKKVVNN
uniref:Uncharacterized protein n=1 Tax=Rhizophora mucronata TaxID=61149 RepID=A0A2P2QWT9_RHIMU